MYVTESETVPYIFVLQRIMSTLFTIQTWSSSLCTFNNIMLREGEWIQKERDEEQLIEIVREVKGAREREREREKKSGLRERERETEGEWLYIYIKREKEKVREEEWIEIERGIQIEIYTKRK